MLNLSFQPQARLPRRMAITGASVLLLLAAVACTKSSHSEERTVITDSTGSARSEADFPIEPEAADPAAPSTPARPDRSAQASAEGARAGHQAALARLEQHLRANHAFRSALGAGRFNLTREYRAGRAVIDEFRAQPRPAGQLRINYDYLYADPFLAQHNVDIHQVVPEEVESLEWDRIWTTLGHSRLVSDRAELAGPLATVNGAGADVQVVIRKRVKRLFDDAQARAGRGEGPIQASLAGPGVTPVDELAFDLAQQHNRCIDGFLNGLADIEAKVFNQGAGIAHMGEFISNVLTDYKMHFIQWHGQLDPESREFPTMVTQLLRQRMLYSMGLRGHFEPVRYAGYGNTNADIFSADQVMRRFLGGQRALTMPGSSRTLSFGAYDVDAMIALLQAARERALLTADGTRPLNPGRLGQKLSADLVRNECMLSQEQPRDPVLGPKWLEFEIENAMASGNEFFQPAPAGEFATNFRLTREFWVHVLKKYGYIVQ